MRASILVLGFALVARAQEASSGFELRTTISGAGFYSHQLSSGGDDDGPVSGGMRAMLYPVWKWNEHWSVQGAVQLHSQPYFFEELGDAEERGMKTNALQAHIDYSRFWKNGSLVVRAGILSSAFGSFLLRYDDAANPLIDMPVSYGYYYKGVSDLGLAGIQADATIGKLDFRAQFANSSPANPRNLLDSDQYGNWAGGFGYTIKQGFRLGASAYRGPYLSRDYAYFFPGEIEPKDLPATGVGIDASWGRGPWNAYGEWQGFQMDYHAIPTYRYRVGYGEIRRVLNPRWFVAARVGYLHPAKYSGKQIYETAVGYRPNSYQIVKAGYEIQQGPAIRGTLANTFAIQIVTSFRAFSVGRN
ncbi:MAG TPA: hypothetical protein VH639_06535 [Bryobacteraceae bacterium]|jgi:hypothetical protein